MHAWIRHLEKHWHYKPGNTGTTSLDIPSSPDPFQLGLHALPLGLLDRACTQVGQTSSLERRVVQHTFTHASLINESRAALTNFPTPAVSCIGPACEAGLSKDAWKGACVTADSEQWHNSVVQWHYDNVQHKYYHLTWYVLFYLCDIGRGTCKNDMAYITEQTSPNWFKFF